MSSHPPRPAAVELRAQLRTTAVLYLAVEELAELVAPLLVMITQTAVVLSRNKIFYGPPFSCDSLESEDVLSSIVAPQGFAFLCQAITVLIGNRWLCLAADAATAPRMNIFHCWVWLNERFPWFIRLMGAAIFSLTYGVKIM